MREKNGEKIDDSENKLYESVKMNETGEKMEKKLENYNNIEDKEKENRSVEINEEERDVPEKNVKIK